MLTKLGKMIRLWRIQKGVTMADMARYLNISTIEVNKIDRGLIEVDQNMGFKISNYFDLNKYEKDFLFALIKFQECKHCKNYNCDEYIEYRKGV